MQYSIVIVDDHLLIAKAITSIIDGFKLYHVLYEAENGQQLQQRFIRKENIPDIVLLDISMPVMDGFETAAWLHKEHPEVRIMALTMQGDDDSLIQMIKSGANGYLKKNVHPLELEKALDELVKKGFYYPDWTTSRVIHSIANGSNQPSGTPLTIREKEFLEHVCSEMTYKEIAEKMYCSPRTVESYRDSLFEKLGVKTRVALALFAVKVGIYKV